MPQVHNFPTLAKDLLCFSHLRWGFVYQRPQHLISRWARDCRVWFFEEPHPEPSSAARLETTVSPEGVHVVTPHLPEGADVSVTMPWLIEQLLRDYDIRDYNAWYYTPSAIEYTRHLRPRTIVYDCMDELSSFKGASPELKKNERELCARANLVFTGGLSLYEAKRFLHRNVHAFPSAVDVAHFGRARMPQPDPSDQAPLAHPRLGFFGVIDERLDIELIAALAGRRPDWQIVMLGPVVKIDPASLPQAPNLHWLGSKTYDELPAYMSGWDVAMLPFARNESTRFISPTKTPEYLAGGRAVVSTSIRDVVRTYGEQGLVEIADTPEDFEAAVEKLLASEPDARRAQADRFLADISWDQTYAAMKRLVDRASFMSPRPPDGARHPRPAPKHSARGEASPLQARTLRSDRRIEARREPVVDGFEARSTFDGEAAGATRPREPATPVRPARPHFDCLVVGAGFAGAVTAERLASQGRKRVLICDVRPHVAGNAYDHVNGDGILVHRYGPHIFHTNSPDVFQYLSQFTRWRPYEHRVLAHVDAKLLPIPINLDTVNRLYGWDLDSEQVEAFFARVGEPRSSITTSEDVIISKVGRELYEKFFRNYTRKQWGLDPSELDSSVIARIPVRTDRDDRYFTDKYQAMPADGMTAMFENMLDHPRITVVVGTDYRTLLDRVSFDRLVYTGPIDEYFDYCYGKLPYRALEFRHETLEKEWHQPVAVINYPNEHDYTRVTEFKHLTGQKHWKTSVVYEYPRAEGDPYYPVPRPENAALYRRYEALAQSTRNVDFCGRLATYRYYNMDQVAAQALTVSSRMLGIERKQLLANAM